MCKQREDIWRQRSGNAQTMIKKEAVIINCSEMRTEGTSRPSAGMSPPLHLCNSHHASSNQRITKSSEQRLNNNVIQRRREKYLAFESSCASPDAHRHQPALTENIGAARDKRGANLPRNRSGNAQTTKVCVQRAVSVLSALCSVRCQCA